MPKTTNVVSISTRLPLDQVFFTKGQVSIGTILRNHGRRADPASALYRVERIITFVPRWDRTKPFLSRRADRVQKLSDMLHLVNLADSRDRRVATFSYFSYSAIWRLEH